MPTGGSSGATGVMIQTSYAATESMQQLNLYYLQSPPRFSEACTTIAYDADVIEPGQKFVCMACYKKYKAVVTIRWSMEKATWIVNLRRKTEAKN
jgi:hypothetical protein